MTESLLGADILNLHNTPQLRVYPHDIQVAGELGMPGVFHSWTEIYYQGDS